MESVKTIVEQLTSNYSESEVEIALRQWIRTQSSNKSNYTNCGRLKESPYEGED